MCLLAVFAAAVPSGTSSAQTIVVDVTPGHATNHFIPSKTLGAGIDRIPTNAIDQTLDNPATLKQVLSAGWQPVTYRQNTDLQVEAWHWNPAGTWSDPGKKEGYFTGSATPTNFIRYSFGYALPLRGDDSGSGYSRLTDGDTSTYWKSDPYLASRFTGESDAMHPQWAVRRPAQLREHRHHPDQLGLSIRDPLPRAILDRQRSLRWPNAGSLGDISSRSGRFRQRWHRDHSSDGSAYFRSLHSHPDDEFVQHLRLPRFF